MHCYQKSVNLKSFNTLGINSTAHYLYPACSEADVVAAARFANKQNLPLIPIGQGSNIVFRDKVQAVVMPVAICHREIIPDNCSNMVNVFLGAGENWHAAVRWSLEQGLFGLENLSLIPGVAGAAPVQNIGAYGVELQDILVSVRGYHLKKQTFITLSASECKLNYRDSIFKHALHGLFVITRVNLRLSRCFTPNLSYGNLEEAVKAKSINGKITGMMISDAVCSMRLSKLPDPAKLGNAGSFFKNPIVSDQCLQTIKKSSPGVIAYPCENNHWKLAAGWLIDACGLKGYKKTNMGTYHKQALVIVHHGEGTGNEILGFASFIQQQVHKRFGVNLNIEPMIYPTK